MPDSITRDLPMQVRAGQFQPATIDQAARTIELVWTTGARVRRFDFWTGKRYEEELVVDPSAVDLSRLNGGAPLLDTHGTFRLEDVIGVVERAWIAAGEGRALVRFSDREAVEPVWRDVAAGILRNVSVGYQVRRFEITEEEGKPPLYRAVDWLPHELSLVPVGADAGAGTRAAPAGGDPPGRLQSGGHPCDFVTTPLTREEETAMPTSPATATDPATAAAPAAAPPVAPTPATDPAPAPATDPAAIRAEERRRIAEIGTIARLAGLDEAATRALVEEGVSIEDARARAFDWMARRTPPARPAIAVTVDETDTHRRLAENALLHRWDSSVPLEEGARQYRGLTLLELGDALLARRGISTRGLGKMERAGLMLGLSQRAGPGLHTTDDFPYILANVANKTLRRAYEAAPQTFRPFCRRVTLPDFKQVTRAQFGDAPALQAVTEHGEFRRGTVGEAREQWSLATYGRIVGVTRQVLVNDDLDAFTRLPAMFGRRAADLESDVVWAILTDNAAMGDNVALFDAAHGNLASTTTAPSITSLGAARTAMRKQTSLGGTYLNVEARYLMAPPELETVIQQLLAGVTAQTTSAVNPFSGAYTALIEPRLSTAATAWYMAADPSQVDTIEYGYLQGEEGVMIESRSGFDVDGVEIKARLDFGAKAIDWRGLYKNAG